MKKEPLSISEYFILKKRKILIEKSKNGLLVPGENDWEYLSENPVPEIGEYLLDEFLRMKYSNDESILPSEEDEFQEGLVKYFITIGEVYAIPILYKRLFNESEKKRNVNTITNLLFNAFILDFKQISLLLESKERNCQKNALNVVYSDKTEYSYSDIAILQSLIDKINLIFTESPLYPKKRKLSSKEYMVWKCMKCELENSEDGIICAKCGCDRYGFSRDEITAEDAKIELDFKINILKEYFSKNSNS